MSLFESEINICEGFTCEGDQQIYFTLSNLLMAEGEQEGDFLWGSSEFSILKLKFSEFSKVISGRKKTQSSNRNLSKSPFPL